MHKDSGPLIVYPQRTSHNPETVRAANRSVSKVAEDSQPLLSSALTLEEVSGAIKKEDIIYADSLEDLFVKLRG